MPPIEYSIRFLGTGTSIGIPVPGCDCRVCRSHDPRNRRSRSSVLLEAAGRQILVDTSPEFRLQALAAGIDRLDAVLWTHAHADHVHGLDDLRALTWKRSVEGYANEDTVAEIQTRFDYLWKKTQKGGGKAKVNLNVVRKGENVIVPPRPGIIIPGDKTPSGSTPGNSTPGSEENLEIIPIPVFHGKLPILGWRMGPIAYITDTSEIPEESYSLLEDVKILVLGALHFSPHPTHFSVPRALEEIKKIRPKRAYLTHMSHECSHRELRRRTPSHVQPARDGLRLRAVD